MNHRTSIWLILFFKRFCLFIFRERGKEGEREGEKHRSVASWVCPSWGPAETQVCALPENRTCHLSLCGMALRQLSHSRQDKCMTNFQEPAKPFFQSTYAICTAYKCVRFPMPHLRSNTWCCQSSCILAISRVCDDMSLETSCALLGWLVMLSFFVSLLAICVFSFVTCVFKSFPKFSCCAVCLFHHWVAGVSIYSKHKSFIKYNKIEHFGGVWVANFSPWLAIRLKVLDSTVFQSAGLCFNRRLLNLFILNLIHLRLIF